MAEASNPTSGEKSKSQNVSPAAPSGTKSEETSKAAVSPESRPQEGTAVATGESKATPVDEPVPPAEQGRDFALEDNDLGGYVGVSPEYRTYADENLRPILTDKEREHMRDHGQITDQEAVEQNKGVWAPPSGGDTSEQTVSADRKDQNSTDDK